MKRNLILAPAILIGLLGLAAGAQAQVFVRAPFVRVQVGDGVYVRAPFVNLFVPPGPVVYNPYAPPVIYAQPVQPAPQGQPAQQPFPAPAPQPVPAPPANDPNAPPQPIAVVQTPTMDAFARSFQPKAGAYDVSILNPWTNKPAQVRFTLPEGTPRRVIVNRHEIEFVYSLRQFVRIEFDRDGVTVVSR